MGQRDVPDAPAVKIGHIGQVVHDWGSIFHTHGQGDKALFKIGFDLRWRKGNFKLVGNFPRNSTHHIDQGIRQQLGLAIQLIRRGNINGHKGATQSTLFGAYIIKVPFFGFYRDPNVLAGELKVGHFEAIGQIHVTINDDVFVGQCIG